MHALLSLLFTLLSFLAGISLIAAIHELGHLLMAKWFGIRVKRYMVFFPPKIFGIKWRDTEYGIGTVPLGGFVEIEGMGAEEAVEKDKALPSYDFRTKPAWQRAFVMIGGILFNLLSAYLIFVCLFITIGGSYLAKDVVNEHGIAPTTLGTKVGLVQGDKVIRVNGHDFVRFSELKDACLESTPLTYTILREGSEHEISVPSDIKKQLIEEGEVLCTPLSPFKLKRIMPNGGASRGGLASGDHIIAINGTKTPYLQGFKEILDAHAGKLVTITIEREGVMESHEVSVSEEGKIGVEIESELSFTRVRYSLPSALVKAAEKVGSIAHLQLKGIMKIVKREVSFRNSIQSPVGIASMFGQYQGLSGFLLLVALLSIILALMNLLPIPALDGFHLLLTIGEMITGKAVSHKWYLRIQMLGTMLLVGLTLFLVLNDLYKLFVYS